MDLKPITQSKVIIVEGVDDENLLSALIQYIGLSGIQIISCAGKSEMPSVIKTVRNMPDFENKVTSLGVVRDANDDAEHTFQSVCTALYTAGLSVPERPLAVADGKPRVSVMIWPCAANKGLLEDVCLQSIANYPEMMCVNQYFECLSRHGVELSHKLSKAKVQTFLASGPEPYPHLGVGALKGRWPFDNNAFEKVKQFLTNL